jgi:hypothetical protein
MRSHEKANTNQISPANHKVSHQQKHIDQMQAQAN